MIKTQIIIFITVNLYNNFLFLHIKKTKKKHADFFKDFKYLRNC